MSIIIRKLQSHESSMYREVRLGCLKNASDYFGSTYEEEVSNPKFMFETFIENGSPDHVMFGAFTEERLIGITGFNAWHVNGRCIAANWCRSMWSQAIAVKTLV